MTVSSQVNSVDYDGDGVTVAFAIPFQFFDNADVEVVRRDAAGDPSVLGSGFSITGAGTATRFCTFDTAPDNTVHLVIQRTPQLLQQTDYVENDRFPAATNEDDQDRQVMISQYLYRLLQGSVRFPTGDASIGSLAELPPVSTRKSKNLGFDSQGRMAVSLALASGTLSADSIAGFTDPRTAAEIAASVTPATLTFKEGDIRRYGALTGAADNSTAIRSALLVSAAGGAPAFIPGGTWNITSTLNATGGSSMYGVGQASVLAPNTCDGITFGNQGTYAGTRFFRDFMISGVAASTNNGIKCDFSAASGSRITQVQFVNLTIQNFGQGIYARGMWNCQFIDCWLYNNYQGYWFNGQSIQCKVISGFCQRGSITQAGATQYGMKVSTVAGESCQSLHLLGWGVYNYDYNISVALSLYLLIENCDVSVARIVGIQLVTCGGGTIIRDCWIQTQCASAMVPTTTWGILLSDIGSSIVDKVLIDGNTIICNISEASSQGLVIGLKQDAVTCTNNTVGTATQPWPTAIVNNRANNNICKYNTVYGSIIAISVHSSAVNVELGPNVIQSGAQQFTAGTPPGFAYYGSGSYTLNLTGISGAAATVTWVANGKTVRHTLGPSGAVGANSGGAITLVSSGDIPAILWPITTRGGLVRVLENSVNAIGYFGLTNGGVLTIFKDATGASFSAAGNRGLLDNFTTDYV